MLNALSVYIKHFEHIEFTHLEEKKHVSFVLLSFFRNFVRKNID